MNNLIDSNALAQNPMVPGMCAVIFAYKRSRSVNLLVDRLKIIDEVFHSKYGHFAFSDILLVHDGVREDEIEIGRKEHKETRKLCVNLGSSYSKVSALTFRSNIGLTRHMFRVVETIDRNPKDCIFIEEDKAPVLEGVEFLIQKAKTMKDIDILDTLPLNKHMISPAGQISTLFTDNGNQVIGGELISAAKELWVAKDRFQRDFETNLDFYFKGFLSGFALGRANRYFSNYFSWGLFNPDRGDALLSYSLVLNRILKTCPNSPSSLNLSDRDNMGRNVTTIPNNRGAICDSSKLKIWDYEVCPFCERMGVSDRVALTPLHSLFQSFQYRSKRFRNNLR